MARSSTFSSAAPSNRRGFARLAVAARALFFTAGRLHAASFIARATRRHVNGSGDLT